MPEELPKGWVRARLGEVCLPVGTIQPKDTPDIEFTYFDIGCIDNESNRIAETKIITGRNAPSRARQAVQKDDILFSTVRTYLRKIALVEQDYPNPIASTGFTVIRAAHGLIPQFLFYQLLSDDFLQPLHKLQTGTSYPAVRDSDVLSQQILLPPVHEQELIVIKLNAALSRIARAETVALRAKERLLRYRTAILFAGISGKLTSGWREAHRKNRKTKTDNGETLLKQLLMKRRSHWEKTELQRLRADGREPKDNNWKSRYKEPAPPDTTHLPELPKNWAWSSLDMIASIGSGISVSQNRIVQNPIELPYLRVANVLRGYLDLSDIKTIRVEKDRISEYLLEAGDILFNEGGDRDKLGRGWIWEKQIPICIHQNHVFRARLIDQSLLDPRLVSYWGNTFGQRFFLSHGTQSTNLASINRTVLSKLPVPIPPFAEQRKIIHEVEERLSAAGRLAIKLDQQLERVRATRQSLLREAYSGRLTPQDPNEEPAILLLNRLRAIRETAISKGKLMPKTKSTRKKTTCRPLLIVLKENMGPMTPEELFQASGHVQESVDIFFAELRELTDPPAKIAEERSTGQTLLRIIR